MVNLTGVKSIPHILNLKRTDIDWTQKVIRVAQNKTNVGIQPILSPMVGNAIADYILNGRPDTDCPYIFVRHLMPYIKLHSSAASNTYYKNYKRAGITHKAWDGKSFHAFRRTFGTRLIRAGVSVLTTGDMLGILRPDTAKRYVALDQEGLRVCCMDIPDIITSEDDLL